MEGYETRITLNMDRVKAIYEAGSSIIALDVTNRPHPYGTTGLEMIKQIKEQFGCLVMADISTFEEGVAAAEAGADLVATTLSGYTSYSPHMEGPDYALVKRLAQTVKVPVICEGRIASPEHARRLLRMGAHAIVVGSIPGALVGARLVRVVPERQLRFIFGGFLLVAAVMLMLNEFGILG